MDIEKLYQLYRNRIYILCFRLALNKQYADDLFSETWLRIAEKYGNIQADKEPLNWMYSVCINCWKKMCKREPKTADFHSPEDMEDQFDFRKN